MSSFPFEDLHWNNKPGVTTNYVNITFDVVLDPDDVLPVDRLVAELGNTHWSPQSSGTSVHLLDEGTLESMHNWCVWPEYRARKETAASWAGVIASGWKGGNMVFDMDAPGALASMPQRRTAARTTRHLA